MQPLTPEEADLLVGDELTMSAGLELLDADLNFVEDISDDLLGGSVHRDMLATVHGTCKLQLSRELPWGGVLVRPYLVASAPEISARFSQGVFALITPERPIGESPSTFDVAGEDRLYLLDREVGDSYQVLDGVSYVTAIGAAITAAGLSGFDIDSTSIALVLPQPMVWPLVPATGSATPTTWLQVINDLCAAINYRGIWCDQDGRYRTGPYADPSTRPVEFSFDADSLRTIVGQDRTQIVDLWKLPNKWIFVQQNRTTAPSGTDGSNGLYVVDKSAGAGNVGGLAWPKTITVDAADAASLVALGDQTVAAALRSSETLKVTTGPWPCAGHADVYSYADLQLGAVRKVQTTEWEVALGSADTAMTWEVV